MNRGIRRALTSIKRLLSPSIKELISLLRQQNQANKMIIKSHMKSFSKTLSRILWPRETRGPSLAELVDIFPELDEISEIIDDSLYLSGCLPVTRKNLDELGITAVLSAMTEEEEKKEGRPKNIGSIRRMTVRITDTRESDLSAFFRSATSFIDAEVRQGGKVLVHCVAGVSRSVSLILAYLIRFRGLSSKEAYLTVRRKRTIARPNDSFCHQLVQYERSLGTARTSTSILTELQEEEKNEVVVQPPMVLF